MMGGYVGFAVNKHKFDAGLQPSPCPDVTLLAHWKELLHLNFVAPGNWISLLNYVEAGPSSLHSTIKAGARSWGEESSERGSKSF